MTEEKKKPHVLVVLYSAGFQHGRFLNSWILTSHQKYIQGHLRKNHTLKVILLQLEKR